MPMEIHEDKIIMRAGKYNLPKPDYAYPTIEEYEELVGFKVNDAFKMGWSMARTTNDLFKEMKEKADETTT
jgi:hypothetical protein